MANKFHINCPDSLKIELCNQLADLQRVTWDMSDLDILPPWALLVTPKTGGKVIIAFLWDIKQFPASGIAARYKRLEVSVRQGQKLKDQAVQQGLIEEGAEITKTGRIKIIKLTEEGKAVLAGAKKA